MKKRGRPVLGEGVVTGKIQNEKAGNSQAGYWLPEGLASFLVTYLYMRSRLSEKVYE